MFKIFAEKNLFEHLVIFNDELPNWYKIICDHAEIYLNISNEELINELKDGTAIFEYIKANGGKEPEALAYHFQSIYDDPTLLSDYPRAAYMLNCTPEEAIKLQCNYGVIVQCENNIDDNILKSTYAKILPINSIYKSGNKIGWKSLLDISIPPINTLVISDNFLFTNEDGERGSANVIQLVEALLPDDLVIDFHILLIAQENELKDKIWCEKKVGDLKTAFRNLNKPYDIKFELVFAKTIHKRIAVSNYFTLTPDKGFAVFKTIDLKTVHEDNDIVLERLFCRLNVEEGDTPYSHAEYALASIKKICSSVAEYIVNRPNDKNFRILGDCGKRKSINNRLIKDA